LTANITTLLSRKQDGSAGNADSTDPVLSGDGSTLAFQSYSSGLVATDNNQNQDVFLLGVASGTISLVSPRSTLLPPAYTSPTSATDLRWPGGLSSDGRYVVFNSTAHDLVTNTVLGANTYRRDITNGDNATGEH
jgi:hypothetical protein